MGLRLLLHTVYRAFVVMESLKVEQAAVRVSQRKAMMVARNSALLALKMKEEIQEPKTASEKQIAPYSLQTGAHS